MAKDRDDRRLNPFRLGGLGLALLLVGYVLMHHLAPEADQQGIAARLKEAQVRQEKTGQPASPQTRALLSTTSGYYQARLHLLLGGRVAFYAGLGLVLAAVVIWYQQAQAPDEAPEPDPENNGFEAEVPDQQLFP